MSNKTPKVKLNESQLNEIRQLLSKIEEIYQPILDEASRLRIQFKKHIDIFMKLRIFAQNYGTLSMIQTMAKLYQKMDKIDDELYKITDKMMMTINTRRDDLDELFGKYEKFCKK
jgi:hypothetical protein